MWGRDFGSYDTDTVRGLAVDSLGDVVVVGYASAGIDFGSGAPLNAGSADLFIVKYGGVDGRYLWSKAAGGIGPDTADAVGVDANQNIFMTGGYTTNLNLDGISLTAPIDSGVYLAKYSASGVIQWARNLAHETTGGSISTRGVVADSSGNVSMIGNASGGVNFGNGIVTYGEADIYVAKYGPQGGYLWAKRSANMGRCGGSGIATDNDRNVLSTGFIQGDVTVDNLIASSPATNIKSAFLLKVSP